MTSPTASPVSRLYHSADLQGPRSDHTRRHGLPDLSALTLCAVVAGAGAGADVEAYGLNRRAWLETCLDLPNGIPSHDTFGRAFAALDPVALRQRLRSWMRAAAGASRGRLVAIDGKAPRHPFDTARGKSAIHRVSAWASANHPLLGRRAADDKSNGITAIPELLKPPDLPGALVAIAAMGCQKKVAADIIAAGGGDVLAVKESQPGPRADVEGVSLDGREEDCAGLGHRYDHTTGHGHGRTQGRHYHVAAVPEQLAEQRAACAGLRSLGMAFSERQVGDGPAAAAARLSISSLRPQARALAAAVRGHRSIENPLPWALDVALREDAGRVRKGHGPEHLGLVRRIALSLLKRAPSQKKVGTACKRKQAGGNDDFLVQVLLGPQE